MKQAWRAVLGRDPDDAELAARDGDFCNSRQRSSARLTAAASELVRALFNTNEFLYVD